MKNLFENMISTIIAIIMVFAMHSVMLAEMQTIAARRVHTATISQLQAAHYYNLEENLNTINNKIHESFPSWQISVEQLSGDAVRADYCVTLDYTISLPLFNITKDSEIVGYAR